MTGIVGALRRWLGRGGGAAARDWAPEPELDLLPALVDPAREAFDVGAHSGLYARRLVGLARRVVAFEPNPAMHAALRALGPGVEVVAAAVSDREGEAELLIPMRRGRPGAERATLEPSAVARRRNLSRVVAPLRRLDDWADRDVGFVKIDVEGHELAALRGAEALLEARRPTLLIEAEDRHVPGAVAAVGAHLAARGYAGLYVAEDGPRRFEDRRPVELDHARLRAEGRLTTRYVNNFVFVPEAARDATLAACRAALDDAPPRIGRRGRPQG